MSVLHKNILVISDNDYLIDQFKHLVTAERYTLYNFDILRTTSLDSGEENKINIKKDFAGVIDRYDLVISLHCKQLFPNELVRGIRCINVHPGLNPYNRGWFPQVFSIINGLPAGATIHEIDEQVDNGPIIDQKEIVVDSSDNSLSLYNKVLQAEMQLLEKNLPDILAGNFTTTPPSNEGNLNLLSDYKKLCEIDLNKKITFGEAINYLRAMTHPPYRNAFFVDATTGKKIFVSIHLERE